MKKLALIYLLAATGLASATASLPTGRTEQKSGTNAYSYVAKETVTYTITEKASAGTGRITRITSTVDVSKKSTNDAKSALDAVRMNITTTPTMSVEKSTIEQLERKLLLQKASLKLK